MSFSCSVSASECSAYSLAGLDGKTASRVKIQLINNSESIQRLREILSHPEMGSLHSDGKATSEVVEAVVDKHIEGIFPDAYNSISGYFGVYVSNELVGYVKLAHFPEKNSASVHYAIAPKHQGQGLATESVRALVQFAFEDLQLDRVFAIIARSNEASIRVVEKAGFVREKEYKGLPQPSDAYYLRKKDFSL